MAMTADQLIERQDTCRGGGPVSAAAVLYAGTLVFEDADGFLEDDTASGANKFAGVAVSRADNNAGADGDVKAELHRKGRFLLTGAGFAQTSVGKKVHASDNYTLTLTAGAATCYVGVITEYVSSTKVIVEIDCERGPNAHIADPSDAGTTQAAVISVLRILESQGLVKPA